MSKDEADETAIATAIFVRSVVDEALPLETGAGARLAARCQRKLGLSAPEARKRVEAYKQFMVLKAVNKDFYAWGLSPPPLVDEVWHEHILDTRGYSAFCLTAFNQVVHHNPDGDLDFNDRSARRALTLYELKECFEDEYDKSIWTYPEDRSLKRKRAVVEDEPSAASEEKLNIRIRDQTGEETWFKVKPTTPLQKVFNAYATRKGVSVTHLRFLFDGARYFGAQTPADIGMENRDQLDCMLEQGGC